MVDIPTSPWSLSSGASLVVSPTDILANTGTSVVGRTNLFDLKVIRCTEGKDRENLDGKGDQDRHHSPSSAANLALEKGVIRTWLGVGGSRDSLDASSQR